MKKLLTIVAALVVVHLIVMGALGLLIKRLLSDSDLSAGLSARLPIEFEADAVEFDFVEWFKFRPTVSLTALRVANPEGFDGEHVMTAEAAAVRVHLPALIEQRLVIPSVALESPTLYVERNARDETNLDVLKELLANPPTEEAAPDAVPPDGLSLQLDSFTLANGTVFYSDFSSDDAGRDVDLNIDQASIEILNFSSEGSCDLDFSARLFRGDDSRLSFRGSAGPFSAAAIPAAGDLELIVNPAEIPPEMRLRYLGSLLREPGPDGLIRLSAKIEGDLLNRLGGAGTLRIDDLLVGRDRDNRLPIAGEAPLTVNLGTPLAKPAIDLKTKGAELRFGDGSWKGGARLRYRDGLFRGESRGAVSDSDIDRVVNAFTTAGDSIFGRAEVPGYSLSFVGRDAEQIKNSLSGNADLILREGAIGFLNLAQTVEKHWNKILTGEQAAAGETEFAEFAARLIFEDRKVRLPTLAFSGAGLSASGSGFLTFDKRLDFKIDTQLPIKDGGPTALLRLASNQQTMQVPVRVTGSVESPKARPDFGKLVKQQAQATATSLLTSIFDKLSQPAEDEAPEQEGVEQEESVQGEKTPEQPAP